MMASEKGFEPVFPDPKSAKADTKSYNLIFDGEDGRTRTYNLLVRSEML